MKVKQKTGTEMSVIAKITVDATGRARRLARRFEEEEKRSAARLVAFKTHLAHASAEPNVCEIYAYSGGYGGCNQVEDGLYNLCFITTSADTRRMGSDPEMLMRKIVAGNGRAADVLKTAEVVRPWLAVPIEGFGRGDLIPAAGMICVGDTAAFIDPFTGSGILMALESAKVASAVVAEGLTNRRDFRFIDDSYRERYEITFGSRLRLCSLLRFSAFVPAIAGAVISVLSTSSHLRRRIASSTRT
jgi:flavin-dependent dehydrogenase